MHPTPDSRQDALTWIFDNAQAVYDALKENGPVGQLLRHPEGTTARDLELSEFWLRAKQTADIDAHREVVCTFSMGEVMLIGSYHKGKPSLTVGLVPIKRSVAAPGGWSLFQEYGATRKAGTTSWVEMVAQRARDYATFLATGKRPEGPDDAKPAKVSVRAAAIQPLPPLPPPDGDQGEPVEDKQLSGALYEAAADGPGHTYVMIPLARLPNMAARLVITLLRDYGTAPPR